MNTLTTATVLGIMFATFLVFLLLFIVVILKRSKEDRLVLKNRAEENARQITRGYENFAKLAEQSNEVTIAGLREDTAKTVHAAIQQEIINLQAELAKEQEVGPVIEARKQNAEDELNALRVEIEAEKIRKDLNLAKAEALRAEKLTQRLAPWSKEKKIALAMISGLLSMLLLTIIVFAILKEFNVF